MNKKKNIEVVPYNPHWPLMFEAEAARIKEVLGENCIAIHHVGSTSVPGLAAKPIIDIIIVAVNPDLLITPLQEIGIKYKGEYNIPLHYGFSKRGDIALNIHAYEHGHPEIDLNLAFRNYLRANDTARDVYAGLKYKLLSEPASFEKSNSMFTGYNLGKNDFIQEVLNKTGFKRLRMVRCTHYAEWESAKHLRQKYFFKHSPIADPYTWTFNHPEHDHLVLYLGTKIIGYAHIQLWPEQRAALRMIVVDSLYRRRGFGGQFLNMIEIWLKKRGYLKLHIESSAAALGFYIRHGYVEAAFDDPSNHESDPRDTPVAKNL